jgi:Fe-S cluster assembly iron-binding protein IscA
MHLTLSDRAKEAVAKDLGPHQVLRIAFAGGCGALGFRLSTPRRGNDGDVKIELPEVTVHLDAQAASELDGATLDYDEEEGFFLDHPSWGVSC